MPFRRRNNNASAGVDLSSVINKGSSKIKKKIRDIKRLLKRDNLPSDLVIANERALKTLEGELENVEENKKVRKLVSRYHKVRFFERKKAARHYKHELKELEKLKQTVEENREKNEGTEEIEKEIEKQEKKVHDKAVNFAYTLNFPETEKYVSLYRENKPEDIEKMSYKEKKGLKKTENIREKYKAEFSSQLKNEKLQVSLEEGLRHNGGGKKLYRKNRNNNDRSSNRDDGYSGKTEENEQEEDDFFE